MTRIARPVTAVLAALVVALAGCGADTPLPHVTGSPGPEPSTSSSRPTEVPATPSPDRSGSAAALSRAEQAALDQELRDAIWANDLDKATTLIDQGADVNAQDDTQQSAYLITTSEGYQELLDLTLAHGADSTTRTLGTAPD